MHAFDGYRISPIVPLNHEEYWHNISDKIFPESICPFFYVFLQYDEIFKNTKGRQRNHE